MSPSLLVNKISSELEEELSTPIDVERVLHFLDVRLDESLDFDRLSTAGSVSIEASGPVVWVNPLENRFEPRRRFTMAHELGHLILHIDPEKGVREFLDTKKTLNRRDSYWDSKEFEANNFAASILMPKKEIKRIGSDVIERYLDGKAGKMPLSLFISRMADIFKVSRPAMKFRLKNVGAIK
jgi:Zn-dependent peptidase ImmA (M78 family)